MGMITSRYVQHYPHKVLRFCPTCGRAGFSPRNTDTFLADEDPSNEMFCASCGFVLYINSAASTAAIIHKTPDMLFLGRRKKEPKANTLDLLGGFVSPRETAEDAVRREVMEEFNLRLSSVRPYCRTYWNEYDTGKLVTFPLDMVFICEVQDWGQLCVNEPDEVEPHFVRVDQLELDQIGLDSIRRILTDYKKEFLESRGQQPG